MSTLQCEQKNQKKFHRFLTQDIKNYILGLLLCTGKKNFKSIAFTTNSSYYLIKRSLESIYAHQKNVKQYLVNLVKIHATKDNPGILLTDASQIKKLYGKKLDLLCYDYSGSTKSVCKGITNVTAAWTNGKVLIPLDFDFWIREKEIKPGQTYRKKTSIARELITSLQKEIPFSYIALDGDYGNEECLHFLVNNNLNYVVRMPSRRNVAINGIEALLGKHPELKLLRNQRYKTVKAFYKGVPVIITAHKRKGKNNTSQIVFIVSNLKDLTPKAYVQAYAFRWPIEKMFRTMKQGLGLNDCQSASTENQRAHILAVFLAFAELETQKLAKKKNNPEAILRSIRFQKPVKRKPISTLLEGFIM